MFDLSLSFNDIVKFVSQEARICWHIIGYKFKQCSNTCFCNSLFPWKKDLRDGLIDSNVSRSLISFPSLLTTDKFYWSSFSTVWLLQKMWYGWCWEFSILGTSFRYPSFLMKHQSWKLQFFSHRLAVSTLRLAICFRSSNAKKMSKGLPIRKTWNQTRSFSRPFMIKP